MNKESGKEAMRVGCWAQGLGGNPALPIGLTKFNLAESQRPQKGLAQSCGKDRT